MQAQVEPRSHHPNLRAIANVLSLTGWISFWLQLALAIATGFCLVFVLSGRNFVSSETTLAEPATPGLGIGIGLAIAALALSLFTMLLAFRLTHLSRRMRHPNPDKHPLKIEVTRALRVAIVAGVIGMLIGILGGGATLAVLLSKAIALPQGVALYNPQRIIRALDLFVGMANMNVIATHFAGAIVTLGFADWLSRQ